MLDYLQAFFWSLTYIFLIIYALVFKRHGIPLIAICLNFAWETIALAGSILFMRISGPMIIHISWFTLDFVIITLYLFKEKNSPEKTKKAFISAYLIFIIFFIILFKNGYMLISSFCIDLIMAIAFLCFVLFQHVRKHWISYTIAVTKLLGDIMAWQFYKEYPGINSIGILVLICNIAYLLILLCKKNDCEVLTKKHNKYQ